MSPPKLSISVMMPVYAPTPFLRALTELAIKTLRLHATHDFELVVVEIVNDYFDPSRKTGRRTTWKAGTVVEAADQFDALLRVDKYLHYPRRVGPVKEINAACDATTGELIVHTGNDVLVPPGWDDALRLPFEARSDCGMSSLSAQEPGALIGPAMELQMLVEGVFTPFMAVKREWRYDERYYAAYADSDLVMRMYENGLRAYRNCRAIVSHLKAMTRKYEKVLDSWSFAQGEELFYNTWGGSPLAIYGIMRMGSFVHGKEHMALLTPIIRHEYPEDGAGKPEWWDPPQQGAEATERRALFQVKYV